MRRRCTLILMSVAGKLVRFSYGTKVITLAVLPLLLATVLVAASFQRRSEALALAEASTLQELMLTQKKTELENQLALIVSALEFLAEAEPDPVAARAKAARLLTAERYSLDGYFFVYDTDGTCVVHPKLPELVGKRLPELTGIFGSTITEIVRIGGEGGGFLNYSWQKPSRGKAVDKLGYVRLFPAWGWIIGTGAYTDDIAQATSALQERSRASANQLLWEMGGVALGAVLLVFAGLLILNLNEKHLADRRLLELARRVVERGDEERSRVARLLHDDLSQLLVAIRYRFESLGAPLTTDGDRASLRTGVEGLKQALRTVRELSHELCPPELADLGLGTALASYVETYRKRVRIDVRFEDETSGCELTKEQSLHLFRICQEALTNVERHSGAARARVRLATEQSRFQLTVTDDGSGFKEPTAEKAQTKGIGLRNMRERIEHLGGMLTIRTRCGETSVIASFPMRSAHHV